MSQLSLEKAFNFDADDLQLNRIGRVSPAQKKRLMREAWLPFLVLILPIAACGIVSFIGSRNSENISSSIAGFMLLSLFIVIGLGYVGQQNLVRAAEESGVTTAFGKIKLQDDKRNLLLLEIDGLIFRLFGWQLPAFDVEKAYRIYYLNDSMKVLSAEIAVKRSDTPRKRHKFPTGVPQL